MAELIGYSVLFVALLGHTLLAARLYRNVHRDANLTFVQKNNLKLKALVFPLGLWLRYRSEQKG